MQRLYQRMAFLATSFFSYEIEVAEDSEVLEAEEG